MTMRWNSLMKAIVLLTLILMLCTALMPVNVAAVYHVQTAVLERTKEDIRRTWLSYLPAAVEEKDLFVIEPDVHEPFAFGEVRKEVLEDGLRAVNFARYLAGLPDDITLDYGLAAQQQAGAILLAHLGGGLDHRPAQPKSMPDDFFKLALRATASSNLAAGRTSFFYQVMLGYMPDRSPQNIMTVGHRRWILNPRMKKTMFGIAYNPDSEYLYYATMYAINKDRPQSEVQFQYIAWPSAGYFPLEVFHPSDPWSVSLDSSVYDNSRIHELRVTVTRERDNRIWELDLSDNDASGGDFLHVDTSSYGLNYAIIFRPGGIDAFEPDDRYQIRIDHLYLKNATNPTSLSYTTEFFPLTARFNMPVARPIYMVPGDSYLIPLVGEPSIIVSTDPDVATVDDNGRVTAHHPGKATIKVDHYFGQVTNVLRIYVTEPSGRFSAWAEAEVKEAAASGMLHTNPLIMDLQMPVTRREFVAWAVEMLTAIDPKVSEELQEVRTSPFIDVQDSEQSILWGYENGLITGTGNDTFAPNNSITREQAATLLMRIYRYLGGEESGTVLTIEPFADDSQIASWAKEAVLEAKAHSIMNGADGNRFDPQGTYSREQTIITLYRLYKPFMLSS